MRRTFSAGFVFAFVQLFRSVASTDNSQLETRAFNGTLQTPKRFSSAVIARPKSNSTKLDDMCNVCRNDCVKTCFKQPQPGECVRTCYARCNNGRSSCALPFIVDGCTKCIDTIAPTLQAAFLPKSARKSRNNKTRSSSVVQPKLNKNAIKLATISPSFTAKRKVALQLRTNFLVCVKKAVSDSNDAKHCHTVALDMTGKLFKFVNRASHRSLRGYKNGIV